MSQLRERIAGERRRLREVRQAMTAAVAQGASGDDKFVLFYLAVGDYFDAAMERLHTQDIRMGEMLRDKADLAESSNIQAIAELDDRLAGNQDHLQQLLHARDELRLQGVAALPEFEAAGQAYSDYIVASMGHHPGSTDMAAKLFSAEDWEYMADVSEADQQREKELYAAVFDAVPEVVSLPKG
jgi:hypothetical protein